MQSKGFSDDAIRAAIVMENQIECSLSLEQKEINTLLKSALTNYPKQKTSFSTFKRSSLHYYVDELAKIQFPDKPDIVEDLFPSEGVAVFGALQKLGKTFFFLQCSNVVAEGKDFLGFKTTKGNVYYLALEDSYKKISNRFKKFEDKISHNIHLEFKNAYDSTLDFEN